MPRLISGAGLALALCVVVGCSGGGHSSSSVSPPTQPTTPTATQVAFSVQPSAVATATAIAPAVQVVARTAAGATATNFTGTIALALGSNPGGAALAGTTSVGAVSGVATFANLVLDKGGAGYTLVASATGLASATSSAFTVTAPAAPTTTKLFISPILNFRLRTTATPNTGAGVELCLSTMEWTATLAGDMVGTSYAITLGVKTGFNSSGSGTLRSEIIHKRGAAETVLATTTFVTTTTYGVQAATLTGPDPTTIAGDLLLLRVRIVTPSAGLPCVTEFAGTGADSFILVPLTAVTP